MKTEKTYSIQYKDKYGESQYYMNIGFTKEKSADDELERILKEQAFLKERGVTNKKTERSDLKVVERNIFKINPKKL